MKTRTWRLTRAAVVCAALAVPCAATPALAADGGAQESPVVPTSEQSLEVMGVDGAALSALRDEAPTAAPDVLTRPTGTEPFDLVGVTWKPSPGAGAVGVQVRVREAGVWSDWESLPVEDGGPDPGSAEAEAAADVVATAPLVTDGADGVQVRLDASGASPQDVEVSLVNGGQDPAGSTTGASAAPSRVSAAGVAPAVITRAEWGADESYARSTSQNAPLRAMVVHHTASSNNYTSKEAALRQLRSVYAYHTQTLGWADIGYNFVVDKFGNVYEGRRGSITSRPTGAHASGFNTATMGVSALGNYEEATPSSAMVTSIARVVAWKLGEAGIDPRSTTTLTSAGGGTSRYSRGRVVTLPTVLQHKDVGLTACPGVRMSARMNDIRAMAAQRIAGGTPTPSPTPAPTPKPTATPTRPAGWSDMTRGVPLTGDWDGDNHDEIGLFQDGRVALRMDDGTVRRYNFGTRGDLPVVGDWDGNGVDSVGVFRNGLWFLRNSHSSGGWDQRFQYGTRGATPVTGSWDGRRQGIGVIIGNTWYLRKSSTAGAAETVFVWGKPGWRPLIGDWDGNGSESPGLQDGYHRYLSNSFDGRSVPALRFGRAVDVGFAGDLDGDRRATLGVLQGNRFLWRDDLRSGVATGQLDFLG